MIRSISKKEAIDIVRRKWDEQGQCRSCGWHAGLYEYDLDEDVEVDIDRQNIKLRCLSKDAEEPLCHRGVIIYFS